MKRDPTYTGASGRISIDELSSLGTDWAIQPKHDGAYAMLLLGDAGEVVRVISRTGNQYPEHIHQLTGQVVGAPNSVLMGEGTWHTEEGIAESLVRGYPIVHVFDALLVAGVSMIGVPYSVRREKIYRAYSQLQEGDDGRDWDDDKRGRAHYRGSGRFTVRGATGWRRVAMVEQVRVDKTPELWDRVRAGQIEGVVAVRQTSLIGQRGAKYKCKPIEMIDAIVMRTSERASTVRTFGGLAFSVPSSGLTLHAGCAVEVLHEGWYRTGLPKFPRINRVRFDLTP